MLTVTEICALSVSAGVRTVRLSDDLQQGEFKHGKLGSTDNSRFTRLKDNRDYPFLSITLLPRPF